MVFQCFLDDSKDQDQSKVFVSAGFLGTIEYWSDLRAAWSKCLKQFGLEYFKTSEFKMLRGQFEVLKSAAYPSPKGREKANEIRDSLLAVLVKRDPLQVGTAERVLGHARRESCPSKRDGADLRCIVLPTVLAFETDPSCS